mgnify:CR=1 FL=1
MSRIVILSDRIKELSHTTGQGTFTLDGAATGFSPFQDFYEYGDVVWYAATDGISYEVGSGEFVLDGSSNTLSRNPFRSSNLDSGPYYINATSDLGSTAGTSGYFFPLYLTKSKASGVSGSSSIHKHTFVEHPGITFWMPNSPMVHGGQVSWLSGSGSSYATSGAPINFSAGIKEIYVTYPAKYSVTTSHGVSGFKEPEHGGVAFWGSEQSLDYDENFAWDTTNNNLGITQTLPEYALDIGGNIVYSQVRASGFIDGGSGVAFSGGVALPQAATKTASGGRQVEPFFRNELDNQTGSDAVFSLSGLVDERLLLQTQIKGTIFAGPASGCIGSCNPDYPTFRYLEVEDIPDLSSLYVVQKNNIDAGSVPVGAISHWDSSGVIEYDSNFVFLNSTERLGVGSDTPTHNLSVSGNVRFDGPNHAGCELTASGNSEFGNNVVITNNATVGGNITVSGNLDVQGDVTYIDSSTVTVFDKQLELASMSGTAVYTDQVIDSGGIVLKSTTATSGDKHFIYSEANGAWYSDQSLLLDVGQKIKFNGGPDISGAYHAGSGLELHNGVEFNVGDLFNIIGESGTANSLPSSGTIHQGQLLSVSGNAGTHVVFHQDPTGSGLIEINTAALSGWAAASISSAGGMSSWLIDDGLSDTGAESITNGVLVSISGVSGIRTHYDHGLNRLEINPGEVSGALQGQITAISADPYNFIVTDGLTTQDVVTIDQHIAISGASGINITLNDAGFGGTNNLGPSGMLFTVHASGLVEDIAVNSASGTAISGWVASTVGVLAGGYGHWKLNASGHNDGFGSFTTDQITSAQAVTVSGLSGITVEYTAGDQGLRIAAPIPFTTHSGIGSSTPHLLSSGLVITPLGASGLHSIDFSPEGSGQLTHLIFNNNIIRIGENAYHEGSGSAGSQLDTYHGPTIAIGKNAGVRASGTHGGIIIGWDAGYESSGNMDIMIGNGAGWRSRARHNTSDNAGSIYLGRHAASGLHTSAYSFGDDLGTVAIGFQALANTNQPSTSGATVAVGKNAGYASSFVSPSVIIGEDAAAGASGYYSISGDAVLMGVSANNHMVAIGYQAAQNSSGVSSTNGGIYLGYNAGSNSKNAGTSNFIGYQAGYFASGSAALLSNNFLGNYAGMNILGSTYSNYVGYFAGTYASDVLYSTMIGTNAGRDSSGVDYSNAIGYDAGNLASGCDYSNLIGYQAGYGSHDLQYSTVMGEYAGRDASGCSYNTMIGHHAGRYSTSSQSIFIGLYAGRHHGGNQAIIIKNNEDVNSGAAWEDEMINGAIDIGNIIQGQSSPNGLAKRLRLGASLGSTSDLDGNCVSIKSNSATDVTLRLISATSQTTDQLASSKNNGATKHTIVDSDGMLNIPVALSESGGELYTSTTTQDNTTKIVRGNGVVAAYSVAGQQHLVVCVGTTWYRTGNTLAAL